MVVEYETGKKGRHSNGRGGRNVMKLCALTESVTKYETIFEILPKVSSPIITVGRAKGIKDVNNERALKELKKLTGVYTEEVDGKKLTFCLYKAGFKTFLDNSFIYYEHYSADYNLSSTEILDKRLERKKKLTEEHLTNLLKGLNTEELLKQTSLSLFSLDEKKQQEIEETIIKNGGKIIQNKEILADMQFEKKIDYDLYLYKDNLYFTSQRKWSDCRFDVGSFIFSLKGALPNPYISNMEEFIKTANKKFLEKCKKCNIINVEVLRGQNKTILEKIFWPTLVIIIPLAVLTLLMGLNTKNILGMSSALSIYLLIIVTLLWVWKSLKE